MMLIIIFNWEQLFAVQKPVSLENLTYLAGLLIKSDLDTLLNIPKELSPTNGLAISEFVTEKIHIIKAFKPRPTYESVS